MGLENLIKTAEGEPGMVSITFLVPLQMREQLTLVASEIGVSASAVYREALCEGGENLVSQWLKATENGQKKLSHAAVLKKPKAKREKR